MVTAFWSDQPKRQPERKVIVMIRSRRRATIVLAIPVLLLAAVPGTALANHNQPHDGIDHIVVIYEENHSFDNLFGGWEGVNGLGDADAAHTTQVGQGGTPYTCLLQ